MALAIAYDDAKTNQVRNEGDGRDSSGGTIQTPFFGGRDKPDLPHASLAAFEPGRASGAHFHTSDQFTVVVDGKGKAWTT